MDRRGDAKSREMMLDELLGYDHVTIQCHDNPDADAIASGYGLYCFFRDKGKDTRLLYSGRNKVRKANLMLMVEKLHIPLEYQPQMEDTVDGLLITVDCQYGAGNVTELPAEEIAVIDHHPLEVICTERMRLQPNMGSCATLVWTMLQEMHYPVEKNRDLGTALYYGLYMDTNQFSELSNPVDMDMRESLNFDKNQISLFRNSNISLRELEIAGVAMLRCNYNDDYQFAVIHSQPCSATSSCRWRASIPAWSIMRTAADTNFPSEAVSGRSMPANCRIIFRRASVPAADITRRPAATSV